MRLFAKEINVVIFLENTYATKQWRFYSLIQSGINIGSTCWGSALTALATPRLVTQVELASVPGIWFKCGHPLTRYKVANKRHTNSRRSSRRGKAKKNYRIKAM